MYRCSKKKTSLVVWIPCSLQITHLAFCLGAKREAGQRQDMPHGRRGSGVGRAGTRQG